MFCHRGACCVVCETVLGVASDVLSATHQTAVLSVCQVWSKMLLHAPFVSVLPRSNESFWRC